MVENYYSPPLHYCTRSRAFSLSLSPSVAVANAGDAIAGAANAGAAHAGAANAGAANAIANAGDINHQLTHPYS